VKIESFIANESHPRRCNPSVTYSILHRSDRALASRIAQYHSMIRGGMRHASAWSVIDLFGNLQTLHQALDYHLERHNVLASNVAHVDTPGYRPSDLARVDGGQFAAVFNIEMQRTAEGHIKGASESSQAQVGRIFQDVSAGFGNDGNAVSLDREATKLAANHLRYDVVSTIVASQIKGLMYAANDGKG